MYHTAAKGKRVKVHRVIGPPSGARKAAIEEKQHVLRLDAAGIVFDQMHIQCLGAKPGVIVLWPGSIDRHEIAHLSPIRLLHGVPMPGEVDQQAVALLLTIARDETLEGALQGVSRRVAHQLYLKALRL